jgi:hypothetical protein
MSDSVAKASIRHERTRRYRHQVWKNGESNIYTRAYDSTYISELLDSHCLFLHNS